MEFELFNFDWAVDFCENISTGVTPTSVRCEHCGLTSDVIYPLVGNDDETTDMGLCHSCAILHSGMDSE